ncbi:MAG: hypothetical protein V1696_01600 [Candidatus Jorgensenbacteria bacterium]
MELGVRRKRRILVLEEIDGRCEARAVRVDEKRGTVSAAGGARFLPGPDAVRRPLFPWDRIVAGLDSSRATTVEQTVRVRRKDAVRAMDEGELDSLLYRGFWGLLNRHRAWAAEKMSVSELELTLSGVRVVRLSLDGRETLNPLGLAGRELALRLRATFIPRDLLGLVRGLAGKAREVVVLEEESAMGVTVCAPGQYLFHIMETKTEVFGADEETTMHRGEYPWGVGHLDRAVGKLFGVGDAVARLILSRYTIGEVSPRLGRAIAQALSGELAALRGIVDQHLKRGKRRFQGSVAVRVPLAFPPRWLHELHLRPVGAAEKLAAQGFTMIPSEMPDATMALIAISAPEGEEGLVNQLLRRRVRWLTPIV